MIDRPRHTCPYNSYPDAAFWARSVSRLDYSQVDPRIQPGFQLDPSSRIATAGSCFAQNLARVLKASGYTYFVTEQAPAMFTDEAARLYDFPRGIGDAYGYGLFSARFGNIYTARQLLQLFDRAYGDFTRSTTLGRRRRAGSIPTAPSSSPTPSPRSRRYTPTASATSPRSGG